MKKSLRCNLHLVTFLRNRPLFDTTEMPPKGPLNLSEGVYKFVYTYPLGNYANFEHKLTAKTTARNILRMAARDYQKIYDIEDGRSKIKPGMIEGTFNRNETDGPFKIWGHDIGDLYFESIYVDDTKKVVDFGMGS